MSRCKVRAQLKDVVDTTPGAGVVVPAAGLPWSGSARSHPPGRGPGRRGGQVHRVERAERHRAGRRGGPDPGPGNGRAARLPAASRGPQHAVPADDAAGLPDAADPAPADQSDHDGVPAGAAHRGRRRALRSPGRSPGGRSSGRHPPPGRGPQRRRVRAVRARTGRYPGRAAAAARHAVRLLRPDRPRAATGLDRHRRRRGRGQRGGARHRPWLPAAGLRRLRAAYLLGRRARGRLLGPGWPPQASPRRAPASCAWPATPWPGPASARS